MPIAALTTPPDIITDYENWLIWHNRRIGDFEFYCPQARATTIYVSSLRGDDTLGDGSEGKPYRTRAKAISTESGGSGTYRIRFERGGEYTESTDWTPSRAVTIDAYGREDLPLPLFNAFTLQYPAGSASFTFDSGTMWKRTGEANDIAWVRATLERLTRRLVRLTSSAAVSALADSWFYDAAGTTLWINLGGQDPNSIGLEAVVSNTNNGVRLQVDSSRCENIRADGFGCHRTTTATQAQPFTSSVSGGNAVLFKGCFGFFSGSHVLAHFLVAGSGGLSMWLACVGGYCKYNAGGDNIFNSYSQTGSAETWWIDCCALFGTLYSSDWNYATDKARASAFYGHTNTGTNALMVISRCLIRNSVVPFSYMGSPTNMPVAATRADVRSFRHKCVFEQPPVAQDQFPSSGIFSNDTIIWGESYGVKFITGAPGALETSTVTNCWFVNSIIDVDPSAASDYWGFINRSVGNYSIHFWHSYLRTTGSNASGFGVDYGVHFGAVTIGTGAAQDSSMVNSIVSWGNGAASNCYLALTNVAFTGTKGINANAYFGVDAGVGNERGYETDANLVNLTADPGFTNPVAAILANGNTTIPRFSHDMNGKRRNTAVAPDRGPFDYSSAFPVHGRSSMAACSAAVASTAILNRPFKGSPK